MRRNGSLVYIALDLITNDKKFLEEIIAYFRLIRHGPHRKRLLRKFFVAAGMFLPNRCLVTKRGTHFTESLPSNDRMATHTQNYGRDL
jgi:hypothetical protein